MPTQHAPFCKCSDPNCPAVAMMRKISAMPTNGDVWSIETVAGFTMATTAAVKNRLDVVQVICCQMVKPDMTEEQMRPEFERVLQGQDLYGNTVMHYFALRAARCIYCGEVRFVCLMVMTVLSENYHSGGAGSVIRPS